MRGRSLRSRGPDPGLNCRVNNGSRYPIRAHQPVAFDAVTGFLTEQRFLVANERGGLVDIRSDGSYDLPVPMVEG